MHARAAEQRLGAQLTEEWQDRRHRLVHLRMQALLALNAGEFDAAIVVLKGALYIAEEIGLPGEQWQIHALLSAIFRRWQVRDAEDHAQAAVAIVHDLAGNIQNKPLRDRFRAAALKAVQDADG